MIRLTTFILALLFCTATFAQTTVEGIGKFKIGKVTPAIMKDVAKELGVTISTVNNYDDYMEKLNTPGVFELVADTVKLDKNAPSASYCPYSRVFIIGEYTVADIKIVNLRLEFYRDTLYSISCDWSKEIDDAFNTKYGKPAIEKKETKDFCYVSGEKIDVINTDYYSRWKNGNITATIILGTYHNMECEEKSSSIVTVYNEIISKTEGKCSDAAEDKYKASKKAQEKSKLSGF
ncbi:MAG TPA: hypothetical protein VG603_01660 [Chitinophagales bacterium]|nr:hypothetical protein [Chitinophagales bacterium]